MTDSIRCTQPVDWWTALLQGTVECGECAECTRYDSVAEASIDALNHKLAELPAGTTVYFAGHSSYEGDIRDVVKGMVFDDADVRQQMAGRGRDAQALPDRDRRPRSRAGRAIRSGVHRLLVRGSRVHAVLRRRLRP